MTPEIQFLLIIFVAMILFVKEILPLDVTALTLLTVLLIFGFVDLETAISGFSNKAVLTVAIMFALSHGLVKTGFPEVMVDRLSSISGKSKWLAMGAFLVSASVFSALINNTAAVAILIPVAIQLSRRFQVSPSKVLIPLSYAAIYGGTLTLIGTSTNLLVASMVEGSNISLGMFEFAKMGIIFLVVGTLYNLLVVPKILPSRAGVSSLTKNYQLSPYLTEFRVPEDSPLVGYTCFERGVSAKYDITVLAVIRGGERHDSNIRNLKLKEGDLLLSRGSLDNFMRFREEEKVLLLTDLKMNQSELIGAESVVVEGLVTQESTLIGQSLKEVDFRNSFGAFVLAIRREGRVLREKIAHIVLHFADTLLIFIPKSRLGSLAASRDLAILQEHDVKLHKVQFWWLAIAVIPLVMFSAAAGLINILPAALVGLVFLLLLRSVTIQEVYGSINWSVIILIAAFIPVGAAVESTGTATMIAEAITDLGSRFQEDIAPYASLSIIFLVATLLTSFISNNAAAIVLVPIAIAVAGSLDISARPFVFAVCFGASTSFMTPLGYQTNLMVYGPGRYRFSDFMKAGAPLSIIFWILATIFIPIFWPF
ncbi:MAG: SLC13 family permease [Candidatus Marinimicrobia bacterium]|nr:SLC13 family permease [Candidatus Neomarinimicrobiota bacterium]